MRKPNPTSGGFLTETSVVFGIMLVAATLRLIELNSGLWYDEILTLVEFIRLSPSELLVTYGSLNNHLLYTWLAKLSVAALGEAPWTLRLPAAVFGVASIWATWLLVRETGYRWAAVATAALLAVSYHHVWFSQNARGYTGLLLFTTLAAFFLNRGLTKGRVADWLGYAACFATAMLVHLSAAFLLAAQGLTVLLHGALALSGRERPSLGSWLRGPLIGFGVGALVVCVVFAPMLDGMFSAFASAKSPMDSRVSEQLVTWTNPAWTLMESVASFGPLGAAVPVAAAFIGLGAWRMTRAAPWIAAPFLIHIPLTLAVLTLLSMRVWPRYFFVDIGFLLAAMVMGAFWTAEKAANILRTREWIGIGPSGLKGIGAAFMIAVSLPLLMANFRHPKQDFMGALRFYERERQSSDSAATVGLAHVAYGQYLRPEWPSVATLAELDRLDAQEGKLWVFMTFKSLTHTYSTDVGLRIDHDFDLMRRFAGTLSGGDVYVYRSKRP